MESQVVNLLVETVLLYWPAYLANMLPPIAGALRLPGGFPLSTCLFGSNKTWRGLLSGIIGGALGAWMLWIFGWSWFGTQALPVAVGIGGLMGAGALGGDLVKSAVKRALHIPSGRPFPPWDQWDFILGSTLITLPYIPFTLPVFIMAMALTPALHLLVNVIAFWLKLKTVWW